ncbi:hypothetical protein PENTCL1PPCAC_14573, partial [Pristionchus entomophagus]
SWNYLCPEWAETYAIYFDFYVCSIDMCFVFIIDCITLSKLTAFTITNSMLDVNRKQNVARLLVQV